jgi:transcriptional regulator with XRE-family HTH domain
MTEEADLTRKAEEIGERIRTFMRHKGMTQEQLGAALGLTANAVAQILSGKGTVQWAKLSNFADVLGIEPNDILGFPPRGRDLLMGAVEGMLLALNYSHVEASEISLIVLRVLDTPSGAHLDTASPKHTGKVISEFLVRQYVDAKRRQT